MDYVLCVGNVADGFTFIGPFVSTDDAARYAETDMEYKHCDWHVILLQQPAP